MTGHFSWGDSQKYNLFVYLFSPTEHIISWIIRVQYCHGIFMLNCLYSSFLDDQKLSEVNQKLRSGCPPDYQIFLGKYFDNSCRYKFCEDFILLLYFSNKHISF